MNINNGDSTAATMPTASMTIGANPDSTMMPDTTMPPMASTTMPPMTSTPMAPMTSTVMAAPDSTVDNSQGDDNSTSTSTCADRLDGMSCNDLVDVCSSVLALSVCPKFCNLC